MTIKNSNYLLRLNGKCFNDNNVACLGSQLANVLEIIEDYMVDYNWYIFNVDVFGCNYDSIYELFPTNEKGICFMNSTKKLISCVKEVNQFLSGVFIAIKKNVEVNWDYDCLPETEEVEGIQHLLGDFEIRTFDTSYLEIYGTDDDMKNLILSKIFTKQNFSLENQITNGVVQIVEELNIDFNIIRIIFKDVNTNKKKVLEVIGFNNLSIKHDSPEEMVKDIDDFTTETLIGFSYEEKNDKYLYCLKTDEYEVVFESKNYPQVTKLSD